MIKRYLFLLPIILLLTSCRTSLMLQIKNLTVQNLEEDFTEDELLLIYTVHSYDSEDNIKYIATDYWEGVFRSKGDSNKEFPNIKIKVPKGGNVEMEIVLVETENTEKLKDIISALSEIRKIIDSLPSFKKIPGLSPFEILKEIAPYLSLGEKFLKIAELILEAFDSDDILGREVIKLSNSDIQSSEYKGKRVILKKERVWEDEHFLNSFSYTINYTISAKN